VADELRLAPADGVGVIWDRAAVAAIAKPGAETGPAWRLDGSLDPGFSLLRVVSGATEAGSLLMLCAARPQGATDHAEELVAALLVSPDGDSEEIEEALISTQYASDGSIRRLGLELYRPGDDYPLRGAGDVTGTSSSEENGARHERAELRLRLDGTPGAAIYELVRRA
jgi:hypothetical protein